MFLVRWATRQQVNADTYFHLTLGGQFLDHWAPWNPDSVTPYASREWLPSQWLSQLVMASVERNSGLQGVVWLSGATMIIYAVVILRAARREAALLVAATLTIAVLFASTPSLSARPQITSFILTAITVSAWLKTTQDGRVRWWLIPVTWVWVLLHGMWIVGLSVSLAAALGHVLDGQSAWRERLPALAVPLGSAVAAAFTPVGPGIYGAVLLVGSRADYFNEWDPPTVTDFPTLMMLLLVASSLLIRMRRATGLWATDLMLLLGLMWGIYSGRTVPIAAVIGGLILARQLRDVAPFKMASRREILLTATAGLCAAGALAAIVANTAVEPARSSRLDARLAGIPSGTPVFSDIQFGGYLMWRYPNITTIAHGYADMYTSRELDNIVSVNHLEAGWDDILRDLNASYVLGSPDAQLTYALTHSARWQVVERSETIVLLAPPPGWQSEVGPHDE